VKTSSSFFFVKSKRQLSYLFLFLFEEGGSVALRNATMAIGRSRRPRGPTYARGANRSQFEDPELADNARHLATRRAHPAFKFFYVAHSGSGRINLESLGASSVSLFAGGPFCGDTSGSRCDAAPGVISVVVSRRVPSASGSSADIILGAPDIFFDLRVTAINIRVDVHDLPTQYRPKSEFSRSV
jgi:hypothetical protein